jgi:hypothetical protein
MTDRRIVFALFAGRQVNMEVALPYYAELLDLYPRAELDIFDLTRNDEDHAYVQSLHDPEAGITVRSDLYLGANDWPIGCRKRAARPRWCGCKECRPAPFEKVYAWYAERPEYADAVIVKVDDDVLFLETGGFDAMLDELDAHQNAVVSACAVNNVVSAKHTPDLRKRIEAMHDPAVPMTQKVWFDLHADADFARASHDWFLANWQDHLDSVRTPTRALPGERPSINCIAFTYPTLLRMVATMARPRFARLGDEGTVCQNFLPRIARGFTVCHLYFGPQRVTMGDDELDEYRAAYVKVRQEYLGA